MNIELFPWTQAGPDDIARIFSDADRSYLADGLPTPCTRLRKTVLPREKVYDMLLFGRLRSKA